MNAVEIAKASYQAYVDKDRDALEALIAPEFHFSSPLDNRLNRAMYFARCWPNSQRITGFEFIRVLAVGDQVFITYEGTSTETKVFRNTEIMTIRDGQIEEVEVYFGWSVPHKASEGGFIDTDAANASPP